MITQQWHVSFLVADQAPDDDAFTTISDDLDELEGSLTNLPDGGAVLSMWIEASHPVEAYHQTESMLAKVIDNVGWQPKLVGVEILTEQQLERQNATPNYPELWSTVEVARHLNVTRQRVHQLAHDNTRFPEPFLRLGAGPLWVADAIRQFAAAWDRKPGRPRRARVSDGIIEAQVARQGSETAVDDVSPAGLYRCMHCGSELASTDSRHLPPCPRCGGGQYEVLRTAATPLPHASEQDITA